MGGHLRRTSAVIGLLAAVAVVAAVTAISAHTASQTAMVGAAVTRPDAHETAGRDAVLAGIDGAMALCGAIQDRDGWVAYLRHAEGLASDHGVFDTPGGKTSVRSADPAVAASLDMLAFCEGQKREMADGMTAADYGALLVRCLAVDGWDDWEGYQHDRARLEYEYGRLDGFVHEELAGRLDSCGDQKRRMLEGAGAAGYGALLAKCEAVRNWHDWNLYVDDYNGVVAGHRVPAGSEAAALVERLEMCGDEKGRMLDLQRQVPGESWEIPGRDTPKTVHRVAVDATGLGPRAEHGMRAVEAGIAAWMEHNPGTVFGITGPADADIVIGWQDDLEGDRVGWYQRNATSAWDPGSGTYRTVWDDTIMIGTGGYDCAGVRHHYAEATMAGAIAHELGHYLGMGHLTDEDHLMWGDRDPPPVAPDRFDDLGYAVPPLLRPESGARFVGDAEIHAEMTSLDAEIESLRGQVPESTRHRTDYDRAVEVYDRLNARIDVYNGLVEEWNCRNLAGSPAGGATDGLAGS